MTSGITHAIVSEDEVDTSGHSDERRLSRDALAAIVKRSAGDLGDLAKDGLDWKRLVERAMEIDIEQSGGPLTEGQWDFGLDMLTRAEAPPEGSGLADREERIILALSRALAELQV